MKNGGALLYNDLPKDQAALWESRMIAESHAVQVFKTKSIALSLSLTTSGNKSTLYRVQIPTFYLPHLRERSSSSSTVPRNVCGGCGITGREVQFWTFSYVEPTGYASIKNCPGCREGCSNVLNTPRQVAEVNT